MKRIEVDRWGRFFRFRGEGLSTEQAAKRARLSASSAYRFESGDPSSSGVEAAAVLGVSSVAGMVVALPLSADAQRALDDFAFFRLRFFGRKSTPWQERSAYEVLRLHETDQREYVVQNEPPGSGKSTLFTHDIPAWMIARERSIRVMIGSETGRQSRTYLNRLKKTFERPVPLKADVDKIAAGIAWDGASTVAADFGPFKPEGRTEVWSANQFTVRQHGGVSVDDKEPTCSAWGRDEKFLGGRYDVVIWDDVISRKPSAELWEQIVTWWMTEAETRLEPGGLLILQGQRMWADDLYRFCLDMKRGNNEPKYRHMVFPAHDQQRCTGDHDGLKPWPDSCLLDPHRLPWTQLEMVRRNDPRVFEVQYQQNDGAGEQSLVNPLWISGGQDEKTGTIFPGCLDDNRSLAQIADEDRDGWSVVSIDPSPTKFWAIQWWIAKPEKNRYILVDKHRAVMGSPDFLTYNIDTGEWSGLLQEWRAHSVDIGAPLTHVIVEINAAQRWLLTQPHIQKWQSTYAITFIPHQTHSNKNDPKYGVVSLADFFRQGMIRLPFADADARLALANYRHELTRWPQANTDDEVMATWFFLKALDTNYTPRAQTAPTMPRPGWYKPYSGRGIPDRRPSDTPASRLAKVLA